MNRYAVWIAACLSLSGVARSQIFINEILENPPGASYAENQWEYIELYGRPGMLLDGYALLVVKGGVDDDRNGTPEIQPHIDEVFILDGLRLTNQGLLLLVNSDPTTSRSILSAVFAHETDFPGRDHIQPDASATFQQVGADPSRSAPRLDHDGSSTYMLVRNVPKNLAATLLAPGFEHDTDFDGRFDIFATPPASGQSVQRFQIVDLLSWSNRGGKEYGWIQGHEISETHGINPDAISRIAFHVDPPSIGSRTKDRRDHTGKVVGFSVLPTTIADESFIYGVLDSSRFPRSLAYFAGSDIDGWTQLKSPTDVRAMPYEISDQDPEPDTDPFPRYVRQSVSGQALLADTDVAGFGLTPGALNDLPARNIHQERLIPGDLDFDSDVDKIDISIAEALLGISIDDQLESSSLIDFKWQGDTLQKVLALVELSDDSIGEDTTVTQRDVERVRELFRQGKID